MIVQLLSHTVLVKSDGAEPGDLSASCPTNHAGSQPAPTFRSFPMNPRCFIVAVTAILSLATAMSAIAEDEKWITLFDGKSLD